MNKKDILVLLDKYMENNKISNKDLEFYLKEGTRNFDTFMKRNKITDTKLVKECVNMKSSKEILTLEGFSNLLNEDFKFNKLAMCLYKGIEPATIEYEKTLADHFDTNLSNVKLVDKYRNLFEISDWGINKFKAVIYHNDDFNIIQKNIIDYIFQEMSKMSVEVIDGVEVELKTIINEDSLDNHINSKIDDKKIRQIISDSVDLDYTDKIGDYYIWSKK